MNTGLSYTRYKPLNTTAKKDINKLHRRNTFALTKDEILFIAFTLSNPSSGDAIGTVVFLISTTIRPDRPIKAVEHTNIACTKATEYLILVITMPGIKIERRAKTTVINMMMIMNLFADLVTLSMSGIYFSTLSMFIADYTHPSLQTIRTTSVSMVISWVSSSVGGFRR